MADVPRWRCKLPLQPSSTGERSLGRDFPFSRALRGCDPPPRAPFLALAAFRLLPSARCRRLLTRRHWVRAVYSTEVEPARLTCRLEAQMSDGAASCASISLSPSAPALQAGASGWAFGLPCSGNGWSTWIRNGPSSHKAGAVNFTSGRGWGLNIPEGWWACRSFVKLWGRERGETLARTLDWPEPATLL